MLSTGNGSYVYSRQLHVLMEFTWPPKHICLKSDRSNVSLVILSLGEALQFLQVGLLREGVELVELWYSVATFEKGWEFGSCCGLRVKQTMKYCVWKGGPSGSVVRDGGILRGWDIS